MKIRQTECEKSIKINDTDNIPVVYTVGLHHIEEGLLAHPVLYRHSVSRAFGHSFIRFFGHFFSLVNKIIFLIHE